MKDIALKIIAFLLLFGVCISLFSCNKEEPDTSVDQDVPNQEENNEDTEEEIPVEMLDLVADDKLIYSIIFPDNATGGNKRAAGIIGNKVKAEGISASVLSVENMTSDIQKKLWIGNIKDLPDTDMTIGSIDIDKIGVNGFIIKQEGDNILVTANNDKALVEAAEYFARVEGILPAPESSHAIRVAIDEALKCRETGEEKTILFGLTGTGYFDMVAYEKFHNGQMGDYIPTDEELEKYKAKLPKV